MADKKVEPKELSESELIELVGVAKDKFADIGGDHSVFVLQALLPVFREAGVKVVK